MSEERKKEILAEVRERGIAFVEDDWRETSEGDVFNPIVDHENAEMFIMDLLNEC